MQGFPKQMFGSMLIRLSNSSLFINTHQAFCIPLRIEQEIMAAKTPHEYTRRKGFFQAVRLESEGEG